jgi:uncharacterized protein (DUF1697 family)
VADPRHRGGGDRRNRAFDQVSVYVALLRGVNVGGRGKLEMSRLKAVFEELGCSDVRTYINSGNVLFRDRRSASTLTRLAEQALGLRVAIRTLAEMRTLCDSIPSEWTNDKEQKTDVAFRLDGKGDRAFNVLRSELQPGRSIVEMEGAVTVRNVNTVRKLTALMSEL